MISLGLGEFSTTGWSGIAPLFEKEFSPQTGVDYWMWSFQIAGAGSLMSGINFLVTILKLRAPGLTLMRMPLFALDLPDHEYSHGLFLPRYNRRASPVGA